MFFSAVDIAVLIIGFLSIAIWIFFFIKGRKYKDLFADLEEEKWRFKDIGFK